MSDPIMIELDCAKCGRPSARSLCDRCETPAPIPYSLVAAQADAYLVANPVPSEMIPAVEAAIAQIQATAAPSTLVDDLTAIATQGASNAAVQGAGSLAGGQLRAVGFANQDGYITAIRNGVPAHTHREYLNILRGRFALSGAALAKLNLPGPQVIADLPTSQNPIVHEGVMPSRATMRPFVVGPAKTDVVEAAPVVKLEHGTMIAGAIAEGHGVLVGWSGKGKLTRAALVDAIAEHDVKPPAATSARAQAGRVMSALTGSGYVVRIARGGGAVTQWTVGSVNHKSAVGAELGSVELRAFLSAAGELTTEGSEGLGAKVKAEFAALVGEEIHQAGDVTSWLGGVLASRYDAVRFGVGWYVPARHAAAAGALCASVSKIFGVDWIVPALPVATSDQLRDGIVRGLTSEVDALMARMATERATAKAARDGAVEAAKAAQYLNDAQRFDAVGKAMAPSGDIGPKRAQTFMVELRGIGARIVAYGQVLGEERLASAKEQVRQAVIELETVLGDDFQGIAARFAGVWDEIEFDRKRSGGVL